MNCHQLPDFLKVIFLFLLLTTLLSVWSASESSDGSSSADSVSGTRRPDREPPRFSGDTGSDFTTSRFTVSGTTAFDLTPLDFATFDLLVLGVAVLDFLGLALVLPAGEASLQSGSSLAAPPFPALSLSMSSASGSHGGSDGSGETSSSADSCRPGAEYDLL